jgi:hypothetical protein
MAAFISARLGGNFVLEQIRFRDVGAATASKRSSLPLVKKHQVICQLQKAQRSAVLAMAASTEASTVSGTMADLKNAGK